MANVGRNLELCINRSCNRRGDCKRWGDSPGNYEGNVLPVWINFPGPTIDFKCWKTNKKKLRDYLPDNPFQHSTPQSVSYMEDQFDSIYERATEEESGQRRLRMIEQEEYVSERAMDEHVRGYITAGERDWTLVTQVREDNGEDSFH